MERCPCCNARLRERIVCARCQADLTTLTNAAQAAETWLSTAMDCLAMGELEQSVAALEFSLTLNKTQLACVFRDFIIEQQTQKILNLLAEKQIMAAKQVLYALRGLYPYSVGLQKLNAFSDYLMINPRDEAGGGIARL
jgi:methylphosphotriester-DNA--protein-cysteine methyltransferase